jgi:hypothetical protein
VYLTLPLESRQIINGEFRGLDLTPILLRRLREFCDLTYQLGHPVRERFRRQIAKCAMGMVRVIVGSPARHETTGFVNRR